MATETRRRTVVRPPVDIYESEVGLLLRFDVPGVEQDDIDVRYHREVLTLEATRARGDVDVVYARTFALPKDVDHTGITARVADGVLDLLLPRREDARPRRVAVTGA